jgi:hypothetical protein
MSPLQPQLHADLRSRSAPSARSGADASERRRSLGHSAKTVSAARCFAVAVVPQTHPFVLPLAMVDLRVMLVERHPVSLELAPWSCWTSDNKGRSSHPGGMRRDSQRTASFAHIKAYGQCDGEAPMGYIAPPYASDMGDGRSHSLVVTRRLRVGARFDSWDPSGPDVRDWHTN